MYQNEKQKSELIDRYLRNELGAEERIQFEEKLNQDPNFYKEVKEHEQFISDLKRQEKKNQLKKQLNELHAEMDPEKTTKNNQKFLKKEFIGLAAAAACISLLLTCTAFFMIDHWGNKQTAHYTELRRDLEKIKKSQSIILRDINESKPEQEQSKYSGTGFALSADGYIITSYHIIKDAKTVYVENKKNERYKVKIISKDRLRDLAILKITDTNFVGLGSLPYSIKKKPADLGEPVFTLGYPREDVVYGEGSISAGTGFEGDTIAYQISIPVNPGNSGGPLFDAQGNLIGIISGKQSESEGTAFAVKSDCLLSLLKDFPQDSVTPLPILTKYTSLRMLKRPEQLKKLGDFVFVVKVYN
jgi:S1-C subfamily serine protease